MSGGVQLNTYDNSWYHPGRNLLWRAAWVFAGQPILGFPLLPFSTLRVILLRCFGASIGTGVVIHSRVQVKYPWHLIVGNHCWIGEHVWVDNLTTVCLGDNVCISQGAYLCTGNHDWSDSSFGLMVRPVSLESGAWAGARSTLLPGTRMEKLSIVAAGAVATGTIPESQIFSGNPAVFLRMRPLQDATVRSQHAAEVNY